MSDSKQTHLLKELSQALYGLNYSVYLSEIHFECSQDLNIESKVKLGLNNDAVVLRRAWGESKEKVIKDIQVSILYEGDPESHPNKEDRSKVELLSSKYIEHLNNHISEDNLILGFWFKERHPAYPVFWDYAYLIEDGQHNVLLIGSSSD